MYFEWRWQSDFGAYILVTTVLKEDAHRNVWVASKVYYGRWANADLMVQQVRPEMGLMHTAAILPQETAWKALFYHPWPRSEKPGSEAKLDKKNKATLVFGDKMAAVWQRRIHNGPSEKKPC